MRIHCLSTYPSIYRSFYLSIDLSTRVSIVSINEYIYLSIDLHLFIYQSINLPVHLSVYLGNSMRKTSIVDSWMLAPLISNNETSLGWFSLKSHPDSCSYTHDHWIWLFANVLIGPVKFNSSIFICTHKRMWKVVNVPAWNHYLSTLIHSCFFWKHHTSLNFMGGKRFLIPSPPCVWRIAGSGKKICFFTASAWIGPNAKGDEPRNGKSWEYVVIAMGTLQ